MYKQSTLVERIIERSEQLLLINNDVIDDEQKQQLSRDINLLRDINDDELKYQLLDLIGYSKYQHESNGGEVLEEYDSRDFDRLTFFVLSLFV